jgi:Tol biopolymer transport system component
MSSPQGLGTFWKRRLSMLLPISRTSPGLSRRAVLGIATAGFIACLLPNVRLAPVYAQPQQGRDDLKGRIFVAAKIRYKHEGKDKEERRDQLVIAIDPDTGKWQKIGDNGIVSIPDNGRVSPDRQTLAFSENQETWICDTHGTKLPRRISDKIGELIWSPDGKRLVATKSEWPNPHHLKAETWRIDADGSNPVRLPIPDTDSVEDWSPDGQWFVTCSDRHPPHARGYQLYVMKTDGSQQRRLTEGGLNCNARFSPDGRKILYLHQTHKEGNSIWVVDADGKNAREIVKTIGVAGHAARLVDPQAGVLDSAFWSPDGKQIAVVLLDWKKGMVLMRDAEQANFRIEIMDVDGKNRRELKLADAKFVYIFGYASDWR